MKTSIATVSIAGTLKEKLRAISDAGFDSVEIFEQDFIANELPPREIGKMVRDYGLEISLFQPFRDFETLPEPERAKAFARAEYKFDLMQELGAELMLICSSVHPKALGGADRAASDLHELGERAASHGLRVGYEALAWGRYVNDHRDAWEIVRRADHPNVGLILDSFHTLGRKLDPSSIRAIPGDKIFFVQLADAPSIDMDLLYWSRHFRNMPGEGDLDVVNFMRAVMATGYAGPISLEIFNDAFRGGRPRLVASDGYRSLIALMDEVRREAPTLQVDLPIFPPPQSPNGFEFVEFTSRGAEADRLRNMLQTLGFQRLGQHKTKLVELWQQGDIRLLINEDMSDFASKAYNLHGTSVCDIGIGVENAQDAATRARALGTVPFSQTASEGHLDIPAIRGLGGSLIHLIGQTEHKEMWQVDFETAGTENGGVGLLSIDHLAQTMSYDEMLSWTLFYKSLFDMKAAPMVDVIDPDGLVRSQAVEAKNGNMRITLNGADTQKTLAGDFLAQSFGAPVQHIAFSCGDIFETATKLEALGFESIQMSANYYDDLRARFSLGEALITQLRTANVLYDEDENGQYFQLYSKPSFGGMFFEIVERRGRYEGYGAANAPFRVAAQKRYVSTKGMPAR